MGKWYIQLESIIQTITKLEEYILIPTKQIKLGELIEHLSRFQSITRNSQLKGILPHDVKMFLVVWWLIIHLWINIYIQIIILR